MKNRNSFEVKFSPSKGKNRKVLRIIVEDKRSSYEHYPRKRASKNPLDPVYNLLEDTVRGGLKVIEWLIPRALSASWSLLKKSPSITTVVVVRLKRTTGLAAAGFFRILRKLGVLILKTLKHIKKS